MQWKRLIWISTIAAMIFPSVGRASYLIELTNGAKFITGHYWETDYQIRFNQSGGMVGFDKHLVKGVKESDLLELMKEIKKEEFKKPETAAQPQQTGTAQTRKAHQSSIKEIPNPAAPPARVDDAMLREFKGLQARVENADLLKTPDVHQLAKDMSGFRNEVLRREQGHVYTAQLEELERMFDRLENILKLRDQ